MKDNQSTEAGESRLPKPALLKIQEVIRETALPRTSLYKLIQEDRFPAPIKVGVRSVRFKRVDVEAWIASRPSTKVVAA